MAVSGRNNVRRSIASVVAGRTINCPSDALTAIVARRAEWGTTTIPS